MPVAWSNCSKRERYHARVTFRWPPLFPSLELRMPVLPDVMPFRGDTPAASRPVIRRRATGVLAPWVLTAWALAGCASAPATGEMPVPVREAPPEVAPPPPTDGMTAAFRDAFAAADGRARAIAYYEMCSATVLRLRAAGTFGPAAAAPRTVHCERTAEGEPVGGVYEADTGYTRLRRLTLVRLDGSRPRYTGAVDSSRVLQAGKLQRDVTRLLSATYARQGRQFVAAPVSLPGAPVELWVVPWPSRARTIVTGGDVAWVRGANGAPQRTVDRTATWSVVPLPATGPIVVRSAEREIAAVGDLALARYYTDLGREVRVVTAMATSRLVPGLDPATGARVVWQHAATAAAPAR